MDPATIELIKSPEFLTLVVAVLSSLAIGASKSKLAGGERFKYAKKAHRKFKGEADG